MSESWNPVSSLMSGFHVEHGMTDSLLSSEAITFGDGCSHHWIRTYDPNDPDRFLRLIFEPEIKREGNRIHWMYNPFSLRKILQEAGFKNVAICEMHQGKCPDVQKIDYRSDVMFMEGEK